MPKRSGPNNRNLKSKPQEPEDDLSHVLLQLEQERQMRAIIEAEATEILNEMFYNDSQTDFEKLLQDRYGEFSEQTLLVLDWIDDLVSEYASQATDLRSAKDASRFEALPETIANILLRYGAQKTRERERHLRLIGIPKPVIGDIVDNEEAADILYENFDAAAAINHLGVKHARAHEIDLAIQFFDAAVDVCPVHPEPLFNRAKAYMMKGEREKALDDYEMAHVLFGGDPETEQILKENKRGPWK